MYVYNFILFLFLAYPVEDRGTVDHKRVKQIKLIPIHISFLKITKQFYPIFISLAFKLHCQKAISPDEQPSLSPGVVELF